MAYNLIWRIIFPFFPLIFFVYTCISISIALPQDEIDFFNVGQGHAVLVNKVGTGSNGQPYAPLLVDAGSTSHTYGAGEKYEWGKDKKGVSSISKVCKRIIECWRQSNSLALRGGEFDLNIIITHPDEDHREFVPRLIESLIVEASNKQFSFSAVALLGGVKDQYPSDFLSSIEKTYYSDKCLGLHHSNDNFGFLESSGCISHLFCPKGKESNDWSIITRIKLNSITAILTGDAGSNIKKLMLEILGTDRKKIKSDVLLVPHHGAENTFDKDWDEIVDPRAIIIGSAPNQRYGHPRGITLLDLLKINRKKGRIWKDRVRAHGIQYYSDATVHLTLEALVREKGRLFDVVPHNNEDRHQHWHLVWTDIPIYTLWTTGSLRFTRDVVSPLYIESPYGLMNYIAVSHAKYLLPPYMRSRVVELTPEEDKLSQAILKIIEKLGSFDDKIVEAKNIFLRELFLIEDPDDRSLYLNMLVKILRQDSQGYFADFTYYPPAFFPLMRDAITGRNRKLDSERERLQEVVNILMFRAVDGYKNKYAGRFKHMYENMDVHSFLGFASLEDRARILRTFMRSAHSDEKLERYIMTYDSMDISLSSILDDICPFGYPEWLQLQTLHSFFREIHEKWTSEGMCLLDALDLEELRKQGKNFKEIARIMVDEFLQWHHEHGESLEESLNDLTLEETGESSSPEEYLKKRLEVYFPPQMDMFIS